MTLLLIGICVFAQLTYCLEHVSHLCHPPAMATYCHVMLTQHIILEITFSLTSFLTKREKLKTYKRCLPNQFLYP